MSIFNPGSGRELELWKRFTLSFQFGDLKPFLARTTQGFQRVAGLSLARGGASLPMLFLLRRRHGQIMAILPWLCVRLSGWAMMAQFFWITEGL